MLSVIEKFIGPIRRVASDADARAVLRQMAEQFGFRSGFLIEYEPDISGARHLIDTNSARGGRWADLFRSKGFGPDIEGIKTMLRMNVVMRPRPDRFEAGHPYKEFAAQNDLRDLVAVPISQGENIAGVVSFSGAPELSHTDDIALQLLCYSLFSQLRHIESSTTAELTLPPLTPREKEVMRLSAIGMTSVEIAGQLGMSPRTVNQHVDNVADKLGTKNRTHTIAELVRHDLLN